MTGAIAVIVIGFVVGMRHALDPDHIAAVGAMFSREGGSPRAVLTGFLWPVGPSSRFASLSIGRQALLSSSSSRRC
jgi:high-affinity nickel permease